MTLLLNCSRTKQIVALALAAPKITGNWPWKWWPRTHFWSVIGRWCYVTAVVSSSFGYKVCQLQHKCHDSMAQEPKWRRRLQRMRALLQTAQRKSYVLSCSLFYFFLRFFFYLFALGLAAAIPPRWIGSTKRLLWFYVHDFPTGSLFLGILANSQQRIVRKPKL